MKFGPAFWMGLLRHLSIILGRAKAFVHGALHQVNLAAALHLPRKGLQQRVHHVGPAPLLEPAVARLVQRMLVRHLRPRRTRAKDPQDPIQDLPRFPPRVAVRRDGFGSRGSMNAHWASVRSLDMGISDHLHYRDRDSATPHNS